MKRCALPPASVYFPASSSQVKTISLLQDPSPYHWGIQAALQHMLRSYTTTGAPPTSRHYAAVAANLAIAADPSIGQQQQHSPPGGKLPGPPRAPRHTQRGSRPRLDVLPDRQRSRPGVSDGPPPISASRQQQQQQPLLRRNGQERFPPLERSQAPPQPPLSHHGWETAARREDRAADGARGADPAVRVKGGPCIVHARECSSTPMALSPTCSVCMDSQMGKHLSRSRRASQASSSRTSCRTR